MTWLRTRLNQYGYVNSDHVMVLGVAADDEDETHLLLAFLVDGTTVVLEKGTEQDMKDAADSTARRAAKF